MPITIDLGDDEQILDEMAKAQMVRTTKTGVAIAIIKRAARMSPVQLNRWLYDDTQKPDATSPTDAATAEPARGRAT